MCVPYKMKQTTYLERSNAISGEFLQITYRYLHLAVILGAPGRPVLVALDPRALLQLRHHDDRAGPQLPAHPPKVGERLLQRSLRRHVRVLLPVAVAVVGVYVVRAGYAVHGLQDHPRVIVGYDVGVAVLRRVHL